NGGGMPWAIPAVAATVVATAAQLAAIHNARAEGFAGGTPGTAFNDFGRESDVLLHNQEAVVNVPQGTTLAGMIGEEIAAAGAGSGRAAAAVDQLRDEMRSFRYELPNVLAIAVRDALMTRPRPA